MSDVPATAAHFGAVWGAELVTLPALRVASPPTEWGSSALGIDALHHMVYAGAAGLAYRWLDRAA